MAKRKGKSGRRIRNWQQRYARGEDVEDTAPTRQGLGRRKVKLRGDRAEQPAAGELDDLPQVEGLVLGLYPGGVEVRAAGENLLCGVAKTFRAPEGSTALAVGDFVTVALTRPEHASPTAADDKERTDGFVLCRQPRQAALVRPQPRSGKRSDPYQTEMPQKVIVANVEQLLIVVATCQPPLRRALIDRFLIVGEFGELEPILVVNKVDLAEPDAEELVEFAEAGLKIHYVAASSGYGIDALRPRLAGRRSVLAGASGVGKSTLINAIVPGAGAVTGAVRQKDERGRHTTTSANIYELPGGGVLFDTPGLRELGVDIDAAELPWYFPEFEEPARQCRFRDCTHTHEPDCGVREAAEAGEIHPRRYHSYLRLLDDLQPES